MRVRRPKRVSVRCAPALLLVLGCAACHPARGKPHATEATPEAPAQPQPHGSALDPAAIRALVRPDDPQRDARRWEIREWKAQPGARLALSFRPGADGVALAALDAELAWLEPSGDALRVRARSKLVLDDAPCDDHDGAAPDEPAPSLALDLAPYRIADAELAIGVRVSCEFSFPAGEGSETRLYLLRAVGDQLEVVFAAPVAWTDVQRGPDQQESGSAVVIVEGTRHEGHFDLKLKETRSLSSLSSDRPARTRTGSQRYVFKAGRYVK